MCNRMEFRQWTRATVRGDVVAQVHRRVLALTCEVPKNELIMVEALTGATVLWSIKHGEREARLASNMNVTRCKARGRADGVVISDFDVG